MAIATQESRATHTEPIANSGGAVERSPLVFRGDPSRKVFQNDKNIGMHCRITLASALVFFYYYPRQS